MVNINLNIIEWDRHSFEILDEESKTLATIKRDKKECRWAVEVGGIAVFSGPSKQASIGFAISRLLAEAK
jgi:hypothetical protein